MSASEMFSDLFLVSRKTAAEVDLQQQNAAAVDAAQISPIARLVERLRNNDQAAFAELYKQFAPAIHGVILARVPSGEVDDLVQDVFLTAFKKLPTLRDDNLIGAWLIKIARNTAVEFYRNSRQTEQLSPALEQPPTTDFEAGEILNLIRGLPETYRETLILRLVEGMTGAEIAAKTDLTPESVRVNLHRGMKMLREKLSGKSS